MDTPKISKLLRLMKLLTGNVSRTINQLESEGGGGWWRITADLS